MRNLLLILFFLISFTSHGQYPFEKYPSIKYKLYRNWKTSLRNDKEEKVEFTLSIPGFFDKKDSLTILLTSFTNKWDSSYITLLRNGKQLQRFFEPMFFNELNILEPLRLADINGDKLQDLKLIFPYMGNGTASLIMRVIYLFQGKSERFIKISYLDKTDGNWPERDFNNDGNYEIVTMSLANYQNHSYWVFNLFNFKNNDLVNSNDKYNYPILIQYLRRDNYKITDKISRLKMKEFGQQKPEEYDLR